MGKIISIAKIPILLVEDNTADAEIISALLKENGTKEKFAVTRAPDIAQALALLHDQSFAAVLLDLSLPDANELDGFLSLQTAAPTLPVIVLTGRDDEALAMKAMANGTQDYLLKEQIQGITLKIAIHYAIQRKRFEDTITRQANFDGLTGLSNRMLFEHRLDMALARIQRTHKNVGLLFLDLNDFKHVNDTLGHAAGDRLLKEIAGRMTQCVRPYDTVARIGGDEFAILIEDIAQPHDCATVAQKLIDAISKPVPMDIRRVSVGVSIGIAVCDQLKKVNSALLIDEADTAMYRAKEEEDSNYRFYTGDMEEAMHVRL
jgi:diguanylate cyclase (GGDEF)-like protein